MDGLRKDSRSLVAANALIAAGKLHALKAAVDLTNLERALTLQVPGFGKPNCFTLAQSCEVILSILCMEIPYVISDLLCVIQLPVFYQGYLAMEINGQLCLLEFTPRSLETDLNSLKLQVSQRRQADLERRFRLKCRKFAGSETRRPWCPAKETYRQHLRKLIDCKLCRRIVESGAINVGRRFHIVRVLAAERKVRDQNFLNEIKLAIPPSSSTRNCFPSAKKRCMPSIFDVHFTPYDIVAKRDPRHRRQTCRSNSFQILSHSKQRGEQWFEIYCDDGRNSSSNVISCRDAKFAKKVKIEASDSGYDEIGSPSKCENAIHDDTQNSKNLAARRVAVRIVRGLTGHFWALPIMSAEATMNAEDEALQNDAQSASAVYALQPSFLGSFEDCQEYMSRLFVSFVDVYPSNDHGSDFVFEVVQPLNRSYDDYAELMGVLPRKIGLAMSNDDDDGVLDRHDALLGLSAPPTSAAAVASAKSPSENDDSNFARVFERIRIFCAGVRTTRSRLIHSLRFETTNGLDPQQRRVTVKQENY